MWRINLKISANSCSNCSPSITNQTDLFIISRAFGTLVPYQKKFYEDNLYKIYSVVFTFIFTGAEFVTWFYRYYHIYPSAYFSVAITDSVESFLLIILNWTYIFRTVFLNPRISTEFISTISAIEEKLHFYNKVVRKRLYYPLFKREIIILFIFLSIFNFVGVVVWIRLNGLFTEGLFIPKELQIFASSINALQFYYFNLHLNMFLQNINKILKKQEIPQHTVSVIPLRKYEKVFYKESDIRELLKLLDKTYDIIDLVNVIYGYPLLLLIVFVVTRMIGTINIAVIVSAYPAVVFVATSWTFMHLVSCKLQPTINNNVLRV